jgi:hypothetical protein
MFDKFDEAFPRRRFYLQIGQFGDAQGVVGKDAFEAPWEGGYRVIPRFKTDVSDATLVSPMTGDELPQSTRCV